MSAAPNLAYRTWQQTGPTETYMISTNPHLLDLDFINNAFATEDMPWAKRLPLAQLHLLLSHSENLGLYRALPSPTQADSESNSQQHEQIGFARFISDRVTTAYLTDVYIVPEVRGLGVGKWLIACCKDVIESLPAMRRVVLVATPGENETEGLYARELGFWDMTEEKDQAVIMTKRGYTLPGKEIPGPKE